MIGRLGWLLWLGAIFLITVSLIHHPFATNDGPVHIAFAHLLAGLPPGDHPLQDRVYDHAPRAIPNLGFYFLTAPLLRFFPPDAAESFLQALCLFGAVAAAAFALNSIDRDNRWLAFFMLPFSLNQMFFLGLYNFCLSVIAFFFAIGTYYRLEKSRSPPWALAMALSLTLCFLCHAAGLIMATACIGTLIVFNIAWAWLKERQPFLQAVRQEKYPLAVLLITLPPLIFLMASTHAPQSSAQYGVSILSRVRQFISFDILTNNTPYDRFFAFLIGIALAVPFSQMLRAQNFRLRKDAPGAAGVLLVSLILMLVFPDTLGSGWTHFRRFELLPLFWLLVTLAFHPFSKKHKHILIAMGGLAALALAWSTVYRQSEIQEQMRPIVMIDHLIGRHCTVVPIVLKDKPTDATGQPLWLSYSPYFQAASRLETTDDRVVLFNFLARLGIYLARFQPAMEPQEHLFHWQPMQHETAIDDIDIDGFEKNSGLHVDYILVWGDTRNAHPGLQSQLKAYADRSHLVYRGNDGSAALYFRPAGPGQSLCQDPAAQ